MYKGIIFTTNVINISFKILIIFPFITKSPINPINVTIKLIHVTKSGLGIIVGNNK